jgi:peptidoglycan LD-endopeptidase CwlK
MTLDRRSEERLTGVHKDLVEVARLAHKMAREQGRSFIITEGLRTRKRQKQLVAEGKSRTMNSRHITGHAIDCYPVNSSGRTVVNWTGGTRETDKAQNGHFTLMADTFRRAAEELKVRIKLGYDWGWDGPHIELDREFYPA